jgi:hypothetical protein
MSYAEMNDTRYRAATLGAYLARHYPDARPHMIGRVVYEMQQSARAAVAWETKRCNVPMTEKQEEAGAARLTKLQDGINASLVDMATTSDTYRAPATVSLGGDPRGPCARLMIPGERGDGFGEGFAIY